MDGSNNNDGTANNGNAYTNAMATTKHNDDDTTDDNLLTSINSTETNNDDPLASSINSTNMPLLQLQSNNKYNDLTDEQLQEFAKIVSPKVSDLLHEQEMLMVDLLDTSAWSSDSSNSNDDSDYNNTTNKKKKQQGSKKKRRGKLKKRNDDDDSMNDEWDQLEEAQLNLKDELDAAALSYANDMMYENDEGDSREGSNMNNNNNVGMRYSEEWSDSIHQYYTDNNNIAQSKASTAAAAAAGRPIMPSLGLGSSSSPTTASLLYPPSRRNNNTNNNHSYTLADHARTIDISRTESNYGLYTKPLLSRSELETLNIITIPTCISKPNSGEVSSKTREMYIQHVLNCTVEYIEPIKSKYLRRMFSGWNSGPGERTSKGSSLGLKDTSSSQRVLAYVPPSQHQLQGSGSNTTNANNNDADNDDSSVDDDDDNDNDGFEDINGVSYASHSSSSTSNRSNMEPLPVRTVTIRIRCDVLCGSVMDALSCSVEELGGEMTKRQGGVSFYIYCFETFKLDYLFLCFPSWREIHCSFFIFFLSLSAALEGSHSRENDERTCIRDEGKGTRDIRRDQCRSWRRIG